MLEKFDYRNEIISHDLDFAREKFSSKEISHYHDNVKTGYSNLFNSHSYEKVDPVDIASGIDDSTVFVGSSISVFKPLFEQNKIPEDGIITVQPCLRTQNKKKLYNNDDLKYNTYFSIVGGIAPVEKTVDVCETVLDFFTETLKVPKKRILIRLNDSDHDLSKGLENRSGIDIEYNAKNAEYYKWKYGMENVSGRGLTIAIKNEIKNEFEDIGNIIIMDKGNSPKAVQWGFGVETLISRVCSKRDPIECSLISQVVEYSPGLGSKFSDTLAAVVEMYISEVKPSNVGGPGAQLRDYLKGLSYLTRKSGYSKENLIGFIEDYLEVRNYQKNDDIVMEIIQYIEKHEKKVSAFKDMILKVQSQKSKDEINALLDDEKIKNKWAQKYGVNISEMLEIINI